VLQPSYHMSIEQKKFNRLRKELQFLQSELEYVEEVLKEAHLKFEEAHREYCKENNIDLDSLNKQHNDKINQLIPKPVKKETGLVVYENKKDKDVFKRVYKQIAKKLHPDIGGDEEEFKEATSAMQEKNLEKLLDICDKHVILLKIDEEMIEVLQKQILETKERINKEKSTYSWKLYSCGRNELCKNQLMDAFLKQLFNYRR
jgi:hypothetical protein